LIFSSPDDLTEVIDPVCFNQPPTNSRVYLIIQIKNSVFFVP